MMSFDRPCLSMGVIGVTICVAWLCTSLVTEAAISKREIVIEETGSRLKRPFCNAFTGCGKKRSDPSVNFLNESPESGAAGSTNDKDWVMEKLAREIKSNPRFADEYNSIKQHVLAEMRARQLADRLGYNANGYFLDRRKRSMEKAKEAEHNRVETRH